MSGNNNTTQTGAQRLVTRKAFLKQSSLSLLGAGLLPFAGAVASPVEPLSSNPGTNNTGNKQLRTVMYNVFNGCIGYKGINGTALPPGDESTLVKTAREMGQIPKRMAMELALYKPDIINFCEGPSEEVVADMAGMLNLHYAYFPGGFPGAVLTRYEIISAENRPFLHKERNNPAALFTRHWGRVKLRLPDGNIVSVHSAHLWPFRKEENDTQVRLKEIREIIASIQHDLANGCDSVLLQGDLNHTPDMPEYKSLQGVGLVDTFTKHTTGDGYTFDTINPTRRIDYIYAAGTLATQLQRSATLFEGNFRMNNQDPRSFALSDHIPVLADFVL